jgi:type IV pilus assembly protein PilC
MVFAIAFFILPNLISGFGSLYTPTGVIKLLLGLKDLLENHWPIVIPVVIGVVLVLFIFMKSKYGMIAKDFLGNIFPPVRKLRNLTAVERFSKTLSILVSSGVEITKALELSARVTQRPRIIKRMVIVIDRIKDGEELNRALKEQDIFPPIAISMVAIGEETGQLGEVMSKVAEFYAEQVDTGIKALVSLLEPLMIMVVGLMVGFIAFSMYDAIYSMQGALA